MFFFPPQFAVKELDRAAHSTDVNPIKQCQLWVANINVGPLAADWEQIPEARFQNKSLPSGGIFATFWLIYNTREHGGS